MKAMRKVAWRNGRRRFVCLLVWVTVISKLKDTQLDIFSKDVLLIPVNHANAHWTAAAINFRLKRIESYDSMGMSRPDVYEVS